MWLSARTDGSFKHAGIPYKTARLTIRIPAAESCRQSAMDLTTITVAALR